MAGEAVDVVVAGAGGGGYPAAFLLASAGRSVVMADPLGNLGGDCLAEGCVPSKAVREATVMAARARRQAAFGLRGKEPEADWPEVLARKDRVQRARYDQHAAELAGSRVRFHTGRVRVVAPDAVEIGDGGASHRYTFGDLVIATGSAPSRLAVPGAELAVTSHDLFRLGATIAFPERPVIIGGGYIGVEVASMLENLGARPAVLEAAGGLLPGFDAELAAGLRAALARRVAIRTDAFVTAIERAAGGGYRVRYRHRGGDAVAEGDAVVMATGRHAVLPEGAERLGLAAGVPPAVDHQLRTANPRVYAPGDVNTRSMLFHSAVRQSLVAAHVILAGGQPVDAMNFEAAPMTVFTEPEAAHVGLTQDAASRRFGEVEVTRYDYAGDARAQILGETEGFIKLVWDGHSGRLAGAQILGADAAQLIAPLALAVQAGLTAAALAEVAFPHPMISEGIGQAARQMRR